MCIMVMTVVVELMIMSDLVRKGAVKKLNAFQTSIEEDAMHV